MRNERKHIQIHQKEEEKKNKRKIVSQSIGRLCIDSLFILIEIDLVVAIIICYKYESIATATA